MTSDLKCLRCRHTWKRRTWNRLPRQCPNCHRNDWNKPEVGPVGRPPMKAKEHCLCEFATPNWDGVTHDPRCQFFTLMDTSSSVVESLATRDAIPSTAPQDASTDDLLNHLLEQIERGDT